MPTSCDRTSNSGGKGIFVIFACILGLGVPGVRYADKLSELFYLHWERFWLGVDCNESNVTCDMFAELYKAPLLN